MTSTSDEKKKLNSKELFSGSLVLPEGKRYNVVVAPSHSGEWPKFGILPWAEFPSQNVFIQTTKPD